MRDFFENLKNGLSCRIDWLSFTIFDDSVEAALDNFGFDIGDFYSCPKGANGYKSMLMLNGSSLRVLYDGAEGMGIHFDVSGSAMVDLFQFFSGLFSEPTPFGGNAIDWDCQIMTKLLERVELLGHVTRLDLAIDNADNIYFTCDDIVDVMRNQCFISKFRSWRNLAEYATSGKVKGHTVYLGNRTSDVMLRIYDKQAEQGTDFPWVRWELELKGQRAIDSIRLMVSGMSVGQVCLGILSNYYRIIQLDDLNKSRCTLDSLYSRFLDGVQALRLFVPRDEKTLEQKRDWIVKQVMPTMTALILADDGDVSFLTNEIDVHAGRMSRHLQQMVSAKNPNWREELDMIAH